MRTDNYVLARGKMVREQLVERGIKDRRVLSSMGMIPRHLFLDRGLGSQAYSDHPFPIGYTQTMSQPFMVAFLAENLELEGHESILEIGTGSGYQAAVLSALAREVFSIERIPALAAKAGKIIKELDIRNVHIKTGDGTSGWVEKAPFDRILLTAAAKEIPKSLLDQLKERGILLGPCSLDGGKQEIVKLIKKRRTLTFSRLRECSFVPLVRDHESAKKDFSNDR